MNDNEDLSDVQKRIEALLLAGQRRQQRERRFAMAESLLIGMAAAGLGSLLGYLWEQHDVPGLWRAAVVLAALTALFLLRFVENLRS